jgi:hypothetical protein
MSDVGYNPARSRTDPDRLAEFIQSRITGRLTEVPGLGEATENLLREQGITSTYQLFGKFLMLKDEGVESVELCDRFWYWLESIKTSPGHRGSIVQAVACKLDATYPGLYDSSRYDEE